MLRLVPLRQERDQSVYQIRSQLWPDPAFREVEHCRELRRESFFFLHFPMKRLLRFEGLRLFPLFPVLCCFGCLSVEPLLSFKPIMTLCIPRCPSAATLWQVVHIGLQEISDVQDLQQEVRGTGRALLNTNDSEVRVYRAKSPERYLFVLMEWLAIVYCVGKREWKYHECPAPCKE